MTEVLFARLDELIAGDTNLQAQINAITPITTDPTILALAALDGTAGLVTQTGVDTFTKRALVAPAAGITITNPAGTAGNITLALADDLAALEGLGTAGVAVRSAASTWLTRTLAGTANEITASNGDGVAGPPTFSLPAALTFTGKTVTGGTFSSPTINTPTVATPAITAGTLAAITSFGLRDTSAAFDVKIGMTSSPILSALRNLTINMQNADRTLSLAGNLTLAGALTTAGAFASTFTMTNTTTVTFPLTGTLLSSTSTGLITLGLLATQAAFTFLGNNTSGSASPTAVDIHTLTNKATPAGTDEVIISDQAASGAWKRATVTSLTGASGVSSIAGNTGAFTLAGQLSNSANVLQVLSASKSDQQTGSSNVVSVAPAHQQDHDSAAKAWVYFTVAAGVVTVQASYNVTGVSRSSAGIFVITFTTAFASTNFAVIATAQASTATGILAFGNGAAYTTTTASINTITTGGTLTDPSVGVHVVAFGRQ